MHSNSIQTHLNWNHFRDDDIGDARHTNIADENDSREAEQR